MQTTSGSKAIGYIRVSTTKQAEGGYSLEAQRDSIARFCADNGLDLIALIPDVMSGKRADKMYGRIAAINAIRTGMANVLVVNTLDRSSRSMADGAKLIADAKVEGWRVVGLDGTDSNTVSQLTAHARLLVAEEERELISRRTKQGLVKARQSGKQLGKPSAITADTVQQIVHLRESGNGTKVIAKLLSDTGIPAPQGGVWSYSTVRRVLEREGVA